MTYVAALPMYDWPERRHEIDAEWAEIRGRLRSAGIDAPQHLTRRNGDLPAVPGGIRDGDGNVIAPDPATLPQDRLDLPALWRHPGLLLAQTCWGPMELGLSRHVQVIGQPDYSGFEGGQGESYSSVILMRAGNSEESISSPSDGRAIIPLDGLRDKRLAYNGEDSMSGIIALTRDLAAIGEDLSLFSEPIETGGHRASMIAVAQGLADVCAADCRSWAMAQRFEPAAKLLQPVGWTRRRKGLPFITSINTPAPVVAALRSVLALADQRAISPSSSG
ncbi:phosphate/phosphite/phosphonate ABC transporter substrate-binding protein [Borborobacter arsenicus]|nr:PhnD/SsuA/transferrin family substrate-binding protein [Pseudaminobacter arsenicus]